jgi:hypothetical protein
MQGLPMVFFGIVRSTSIPNNIQTWLSAPGGDVISAWGFLKVA